MAVEFLIVFIIFFAIMFYIYSLGVSLTGVQHAEYYGFMVGRVITGSAYKYGSGLSNSAGTTKYGNALVVQRWYDDHRAINTVSRMQCSIENNDSGYRNILEYGAGVGPNIASTTGVACRVSASYILPITRGTFYLAFDELMGSDISDMHAACAMSFKQNWKSCLPETVPTNEVIVPDNGS